MEQQQRTDAWFNQRRGKVTASAVGTMLGLNSYKKPEALWRELTGRDPPFEGNYCTHYGTRNEANGVLEYQCLTGQYVDLTGFHVHKTYYWLGGSPDGLVGERGLLEVKCPMSKKVWTPDQVPLCYYAQMQVLMEVTDRDWCHLFAWRPFKETQQLICFQRNRQWFEGIMHTLVNFFTSLQQQEPPPPCPNIVESTRAMMLQDVLPWPPGVFCPVVMPFSHFDSNGKRIQLSDNLEQSSVSQAEPKRCRVQEGSRSD